MERTIWVDIISVPVGVSDKKYKEMKKLEKNSKVYDTIATDSLKNFFSRHAMNFEDTETDTFFDNEEIYIEH